MGSQSICSRFFDPSYLFPLASQTQVDAVDSQQQSQNAERGAKTAENVRYGQAVSEGGMGGETTESSGSANQGMLDGIILCDSSTDAMCRFRLWRNRGSSGKPQR